LQAAASSGCKPAAACGMAAVPASRGGRAASSVIALPPKLELGASVSLYQGPEAIEHDGPRACSSAATGPRRVPSKPVAINYLAVRLNEGSAGVTSRPPNIPSSGLRWAQAQ